ncbi:MAG TPA: hypothetical protein VFN56_05555, partial [Candidatus Saccharimonadales bacterium]|nr:hypothetical protein [Candidatus Saccharimonadales bacterium]
MDIRPPEQSVQSPVPIEPPSEAPLPHQPELTPPQPVVGTTAHSHKKVVLLAVAFLLVWAAIGTSWYLGHHSRSTANLSAAPSTNTAPQPTATASSAQPVQGLQLDTNKAYGNTYANGLLPVGDGKYVTSGPKQGYVYACTQYAQNLATDSGGAMTRGPWFTNNNTEWNSNKKISVGGSVSWQGSLTNTVSGSTRTIVSNDLPISDPTG